MREVFSLSYPLTGHPGGEAVFGVTESEDGAIGVASGGTWVRIPFQAYELLHNFLRQQIEARAKCEGCDEFHREIPFVSSEVETPREPIPAADDWECGDQKLRAELTLALLAREPILMANISFEGRVDDLAYTAGRIATRAALARLTHVARDFDEDELPF